MTDAYAHQRASAARILAAKGQVMVLTHVGAATYDPATGTATAAGAASNRFGAAFDCTEREIDGTNVLRGDKNVTLAYSLGTSEPAVGDLLTFDGKAHRVMNAGRLAPAGLAVVHQLRVRA